MLIQVSAIGYSFQEKRKTIIPVLAVAGAIKGKSIQRNLWGRLRPSILAASSKSFGRSLNAEERRIIARALKVQNMEG